MTDTPEIHDATPEWAKREAALLERFTAAFEGLKRARQIIRAEGLGRDPLVERYFALASVPVGARREPEEPRE